MNGVLLPMIIDVVAHILNEFRNEVSTDGLMLAAFNGNTTWTIVPRV